MALALILLMVVIYLLYKFSVRNYDYWEKKGVLGPKPLPFVGNVLDVFTFRTNIGNLLKDFYNNYTTPYFGMYLLNKPSLILRCPELIKHVMVKDFNYFPDRSFYSDEDIDSIGCQILFTCPNPKWKFMRSKMQQALAIGKIRHMFPLVSEITKNMNVYISNNHKNGFIEVRELCAKYVTDVIASCAFGVTASCLENDDAEFRAIGRQMFDFSISTTIRQVPYFFAHSLVKAFKIPFLSHKVKKFLREMVWSTINVREQSQIRRNDVIDTLIQLKNSNRYEDTYRIEGDTLVALAAQFLTGGIDTLSITLSFTLYELGLHMDIQDRLRSEIKQNILMHNGLTYEGVQEMRYMNMVLCESLRKYPVLPFLDRMCVKDYQVPGSDLVIEKGTPVYIPMYALHMDEKYFPEPETYNPERFSDKNIRNVSNFSYLPFGEGPRNCIGKSFGLIVCKLGLCYILSEFEVLRCEQTPVPMVFETKGILLASTVGLPLKFRPIS